MIRCFDLFFAFIALVVFAPLLLVLCVLIMLDSPGKPIYRQERLGKGGQPFRIFKLRTMYLQTPSDGNNLPYGNRDQRITRLGYWLRRTKLDELPQLLNIIGGSMSVVGPRPLLRHLLDMYPPEQRELILSVRPGLTDYASVLLHDEDELFAGCKNQQEILKLYRDHIIPRKVRFNLVYIKDRGLRRYFDVILLTIRRVLFRR